MVNFELPGDARTFPKSIFAPELPKRTSFCLVLCAADVLSVTGSESAQRKGRDLCTPRWSMWPHGWNPRAVALLDLVVLGGLELGMSTSGSCGATAVDAYLRVCASGNFQMKDGESFSGAEAQSGYR